LGGLCTTRGGKKPLLVDKVKKKAWERKGQRVLALRDPRKKEEGDENYQAWKPTQKTERLEKEQQGGG